MPTAATPSTAEGKPKAATHTKAPGPLVDNIDSAMVVSNARLLVCMKEPKEFRENLGVDDKMKCTVRFITGNKKPGIIEVWGEDASRLNWLVDAKVVINKPYTISMEVGIDTLHTMS